MTELSTLQYPRHIHRDGQFRVVASATECDAALDEGWVLSPGETGRPYKTATVAAETTTEHAGSEAESSLPVDDVPEPDAPLRKRGPQSKRK